MCRGRSILAVGLAPTLGAAAPIRVLILDGESGGTYHDWQRVTPVLRKMLDETGLFDVDGRHRAAPTGVVTRQFKPDFAKYQVVVMNYDAPDERWPARSEVIVRAVREERRRARVGSRGRQRVPRLGRRSTR